jgi:hypothetical protein
VILHVGDTEDGQALYLTDADLKAHAHGVGASRKGKSKLIEWIIRELVKQERGLCLIDPHGHLYDSLVQWLAYVTPHRAHPVLFNPSYEKRVVGFNPFQLKGEKSEDRITTKVDRMVAATLRAWGAKDLNSMPRLERWMRCLYYVLIEQDYSVEVARYFLSPSDLATRDAIIARIRSETIREQWLTLTQGKSPTAYLAQLESTANRLFKFITHPTIRRMMGLQSNAIDLKEIINQKRILLVNLQPSDYVSEETARIVGALLVNEIWEIMRRRASQDARRLPPFYLVMDEFQNFATPDIARILDQGAKYGLHLMLFHQYLEQLGSELQYAMSAAHTRFVFGGLSHRDAARMLEGAEPSYESEYDDEIDDVRTAMRHPAQHYTLRRPEQPVVTATTPYVENWEVSPERVRQYIEQQVADFPTPEEVDAQLTRLFNECHPTDRPQESLRTQIFKHAPAEISDEDLFE